ncbi:MAG: hypothetical protein K9K67_13595 [Bacteriovoracaceae bacterium]|nr:hypothetical protein [Bacteriovoracaceae bacterium]
MTTLPSFEHILFIDPLEKLVFKKDSSLQLALALKKANRKVGLLFEKDFYFSNKDEPIFKIYDFTGEFVDGGSYLASFDLGEATDLRLHEDAIIHMRIDPPFDTRYLRYLWMLRSLKEKWQIKVINDPAGIAVHNEKMVSYELDEAAPTFVGSSDSGFKKFFDKIKNDGDYEGLILKPLDLFQGIGVEKVSKDLSFEEVALLFEKKKSEYHGPVVAQPFLTEVYEGELRSLYFDGKELGTILKTPPKGEFLANIAQGAKYHAVKLENEVAKRCEEMSKEFSKRGVPWIAYDILGGKIQEANLTCPGLLVEVSQAVGKNLGFDLVELIEEYCQKSTGKF